MTWNWRSNQTVLEFLPVSMLQSLKAKMKLLFRISLFTFHIPWSRNRRYLRILNFQFLIRQYCPHCIYSLWFLHLFGQNQFYLHGFRRAEGRDRDIVNNRRLNFLFQAKITHQDKMVKARVSEIGRQMVRFYTLHV